MTLWAYYRVSSDFQNYKSQKIGVLNWCKQNKYGMIDKEVIDDGVSGTVLAKDRALNRIVKNSKSGDILGLMWENIDFATSTITIKVKDSTKEGGKRIHTIPIIPQLERILQAQPKINKYVFNYNGKPIADIKRSWHSIFYDHNGKLRDPSLPYTNFHTLRHTAVTWILKATGDIRLAQKIVGHQDIKTTARYAHVLDEDKRTGLIKTFGLDDVHKMYTID